MSAALNDYERAWSSLAGFYISKTEGDLEEQLRYLSGALAYHPDQYILGLLPEQSSMFSKERESMAYAELFKLQVQLKYYPEAVEIFQIIEAQEYSYVETFRPILQHIEGIASDNTSYALPGKINSRNFWGIDLHKPRFCIDTLSGNIDEIKLHCDAKYVLFAYNEESHYSLPSEWGKCYLIVVGEENT